MPTSTRLHPFLRFASKLLLLLFAAISIPSLLLLCCYLHFVGFLPLPPALTELLSAPRTTEEVPTSQIIVVSPMSDPRSSLRGSWPGIRQPPTRSAKEAELAEDAEVIGICVGGKARAYSIAAMSSGPDSHVINDVVAGCPVSVAYCNEMNCARVYTAPSTDAPLDLGTGGWQGGKGLVVQLRGVDYALLDGQNLTDPAGLPLPYQLLDYQHTTWSEWYRAHSDTDVYVAPPQTSSHGG